MKDAIHSNSKEIVINISDSNDARAFDRDNEIIQQDAMKLLFRHISTSLKQAMYYSKTLKKTGPLEKRYHDTIAIFGGRGTGKTTFILNAFKLIRQPSKTKEGEKLDALEILPIIDPTLVEAKEHVFVNIISGIKEIVDQHYRYKDSTPNHPMDPCANGYRDPHSNRQGAYQDWQTTLKKLAAGLPAIDGIGGDVLKKESWHDPIHVMEQGMISVKASNRLEKNFHRYVNQSLDFIGKKAFVLAFDDVDTDFNAGWPVLETIRKYLTTPQLITILSGDPNLYTKLIRKHQWENFGKEFLKYENNSLLGKTNSPGTDFHHLVTQLEEQYLLKILKPQRRIDLKSVQACAKKGYSFKIRSDIPTGLYEKSVEEFINRNVEEIWGVSNAATFILAKYRDFILSEPIRTLVQILTGMSTSASDAEVEKANPAGLLDIYFSNLYRHGFREDLRDLPPSSSLNRLAKALADNELFSQGYRLFPDYQDNETNRLMLVLGAVFTRLTRTNPHLFFDYLIKIGLTRTMALTPMSGNEVEKSSETKLTDYMKQTGLLDGKDAVDQAGFHSGFVRKNLGKQTATHHGTIALIRWDPKSGVSIGFKKTASLRKEFKTNINSIYGTTDIASLFKSDAEKPPSQQFFDTLKTKIMDKHHDIDQLPYETRHSWFYSYAEPLQDQLIETWQKIFIGLPGQHLVAEDGTKEVVWSMYTLIAVIGRIVACQTIEEIKPILIDQSDLKEYEVPGNWTSSKQPEGEENSEEESSQGFKSEQETDDSGLEKFCTQIHYWKERLPVDRIPPVAVMGQIFDRFHSGLKRVDKLPAKKTCYLGWVFNRYIIIFLNSVLVEEAVHVNPGIKLIKKNPTESDQDFNNNLKKITSPKHLPFFEWLKQCPLWYPYLDPDSDLFKDPKNKEIINGIRGIRYMPDPKIPEEAVEFDNLYPILNTVLVRNDKDAPSASKKENKLPSWKKAEFKKILQHEGKDKIIRQLSDYSSTDKKANYFIDTYVEGQYKTPIRKDSEDAIKRLIEEFSKGPAPI